MSETWMPDKDERVTQVVVIELMEKHEMQAKGIALVVEDHLKTLGYIADVDYMLTVGQPTNILANPNLSEFMSSKQKGFLQKLIADLRPLIGRAKAAPSFDPDVYTQAVRVMEVVFAEMGENESAIKRDGKPTISPRRASELIDATKSVIEDITGELNGV